jgi:hypothetical protein
MAIFSRRRLQIILDDLRPILDVSKTKDFLNRLSKLELAVACEMEIALLWGIQQTSDLIIEPELSGSTRRPEAFSNNFFDKPAYIEVATISDGGLSGEENMHKATQKICHYANTLQRGIGHKLHFIFQESRSWENGVYTRNRGIKSNFVLDENLKNDIATWIKQQASEPKGLPLRLYNEKIDVLVELKENRHKQSPNFVSTVPALAYKIQDNPVYKTLKSKEDQLSGASDTALKVIFLADGGSRLLRLLNDKDPQNLYWSGSEIIQHFLNKSSITAICVFSPHRPPFFSTHSEQLIWQVSLFCKNDSNLPEANLKRLAGLLPKPRFEGYQVRSLEKQGAFSPLANSWYLGTHVRVGKDSAIMKISARLLQEYLAGKLSQEQFENHAFSDKNWFSHWLGMGLTISNSSFESAGIDEDDDYVVFEFSKDPAAFSFT